MQKLYQVKLTEDEIKMLISAHSANLHHTIQIGQMPSADTTKRIHDLTKRLNSEGADMEMTSGTVKQPAMPEMPKEDIKPSTADTNVNVNTGWPS